MLRAGIKGKALAYLLALAFFIITTNAETYVTNSASSFNEGTFIQIYYNTTANAVQLTANKTSGNYTSKIFDANRPAQWNSISLATETADEQILFVIDGQKSVFSSINGSNWITKTANYGGTIGLDGLVSTSNNELILLDGKDIYYSSNEGVNWTRINDQFTPYTNDGLAMLIDNSNSLYIIDGAQRVFKSTNLGYNWTEANSNFNGAVTNDVKGMATDSTNRLFVVDGAGGVYSSSNQGINWTYLADYGGGTYTDAMTIDQNNYIYILLDKKIYRSTNSGINWTKINDQFTPYTNDGFLLFFNKKDSLIIADGVGRIFKSTNTGINWTELGDCNGAATNNPKAGTSIRYTTNITHLAKSCDDSACAGETFSVASGNLSIPDNQYFQYQINFETSNAVYSPKLYNATIQYTLLPDTTNPAVQAIIPAPNTNFTISETIEIAANATDNINIDRVAANIVLPNSSAQQIMLTKITATNKYNNSFTIPALSGQYNITFIANDTSGNINNTETTHFIILANTTIVNNTNNTNTTNTTLPDTTPPTVLNITPLTGTNFSLNSIVDITVNITDNTAVDTAFANITSPDLTIIWIQLFDADDDGIYNNSIVANQAGWYYVTIIANDTSGNINNTEKTHFDPASLGGGGGGGGGGGVAMQAYQSLPDWRKMPSAQIIRPPECIESWLCMPWTECNSAGYKTRICEDYYQCRTNKTIPITQIKCLQINATTNATQKEKPKKAQEPLYEVSLLLTPKQTATTISGAGLISVIILIGISGYLLLRKKKTKRNKNPDQPEEPRDNAAESPKDTIISGPIIASNEAVPTNNAVEHKSKKKRKKKNSKPRKKTKLRKKK